jgi:hypothetical protein
MRYSEIVSEDQPQNGIVKPLTPAQHNRKRERERQVQDQMRDAKADASRKIKRLQSKL